MITASDEFKALWRQKHGTVESIRIRYKRRYVSGSTFAYEVGPEDGWQILKQHEFGGIGAIPQSLDTPFQNIFNTSVIQIRVDNSHNQWIQSAAPPSFFAAATDYPNGFRLYKSKFQIQVGYKLSSGSYEWLSVFTGLATRVKQFGKRNDAVLEVHSNALLLEKSDAEAVSETFTLENCVPATGDGSRTTFETTSLGVDHLTAVQVNAVAMTQGTDWTVGNTKAVAGPANTGRALITFNVAPGNTQTVKCSGVKWKRNESLNDLIDDLCDVAGIASAERSISTILLAGTSGSQTLDTELQWEANSPSQTNTSTNATSGSVVRKWNLIDDFTDGDITASPVWNTYGTTVTVASDGTQTNHMLVDTLSTARIAFTKLTGTWRWRAKVDAGGVGEYKFMGSFTGTYNYVVIVDRATLSLKLSRRIRYIGLGGSTPPEYTDLISTALTSVDWATIAVQRTSDGEMKLYFDGVLKGTATDTDITFTDSFSVEAVSGAPCRMDDLYWSPELDAANAVTVSTATPVYISGEIDLLAAPTAWGSLVATEVLNSGTITYETSVSNSSGAGYDAYVAVANGGTIGSALKRYLKVRVTISIASGSFDSPELQKLVMNFTTSSVFLSLANFAGKKCKGAIERMIQVADYQMRFAGDGTFVVQAKDASATPAAEISQEDGLIEVLDYEDGTEQIINVGRVRSGNDGQYFSVYDETSAGEAAPTSEDEFGRIVKDEDYSDLLIANDLNLSAARAQKIYTNNYLAKAKIRAKIWNIPWLEAGDRLRLTALDNPRVKNLQANDELNVVDAYANVGNPGNVFSNDTDWRVLTYNPNWDTNQGEVYLEKIL